MKSKIVFLFFSFIVAGQVHCENLRDDFKNDNILENTSSKSKQLTSPIFINLPSFTTFLSFLASCGGVLVNSRGYIRYKENATYENNERCLWTIKTPKIATVIMMRAEGFHSQYDQIRIYSLDPYGHLLLEQTM